jgi:hypothetical protein
MATFKHATVLTFIGTVLCAISLLGVAGLQADKTGKASPAPGINLTREFAAAPQATATPPRLVILPPSCSCRPRVGEEEYVPDAGWAPIGMSAYATLEQPPHFE